MGKVLGALIAQRRRARGWSQDELERRSSVDQTNISRIEQGRRVPDGETARKVAAALGISISEMIAAIIADIVAEYEHQDETS